MFDECAKEANAESTNTLRFAPFCESLLNKILKHLLRLNKIKRMSLFFPSLFLNNRVFF